MACGITIKYVHTIGIQGEEKGKKKKKEYLKYRNKVLPN